MKLVISAFPAVGKSTIFKEASERGLKPAHVFFNDFDKEYQIQVPAGDGIPVFDSDSSKFDKAFFPTNYIKHIKDTLEALDDVIILVSSHDDVREMMRSQGIDYVLAYPQRELKEEYIQRYKARGNAEGFIGMMENSWNKFIDSCEEDPAELKIVLGEGEFLGHRYLTEMISQLSGFENMNDDPDWFHKSLKQAIATASEDETTAAIIDANAGPEATNQQTIPTDNPASSILNVSEDAQQSTLTAENYKGGIVDTDISSIAETSDEATTTAAKRNPMGDPDFVEAGDQNVPDRAELIEAKYDMQNDIDTLEKVMVIASDEETRSGTEGLEDFGPIFTEAATDIKARYGSEVEPTLAGMEGFLDGLKTAVKNIMDTLKAKPNKESQAKIKKYFFEVQDVIQDLKNPKWLDAQKFINVGKATLEVPAVFKEVNTAAGMAPIINQFINALQKEHTNYYNNAKARLSSGMKIYNKLKNQKMPDSIPEAKKLITEAGKVTPEELPQPKIEQFSKLIDVALSRGELPVLKKDDIPGIIDLLSNSFDKLEKMVHKNEGITEDGLYWDDMSDFWQEMTNLSESKDVRDAVMWEQYSYPLDTIEAAYTKQMLVIAKFIEMWILKSIK